MKTCAYVLAAGLGSRLRPITDNVPKPLVDIQGRRCIDYIFEKLTQAGLTDIFVNCFYLKDQIKEYIDKHWPGVVIIDENHLSGTGGAIRANVHLKNYECVVVHNGDILSGADLNSLLASLGNSDLDVILLCGTAPRARYLCFFDDMLCGWGNAKTRNYARFVSKLKLHFLGIHALKTSCLKFFNDERSNSFSIFDVYLNPEIRVGYEVDDCSFWVDIGTLDDLNKARSHPSLTEALGIR